MELAASDQCCSFFWCSSSRSSSSSFYRDESAFCLLAHDERYRAKLLTGVLRAHRPWQSLYPPSSPRLAAPWCRKRDVGWGADLTRYETSWESRGPAKNSSLEAPRLRALKSSPKPLLGLCLVSVLINGYYCLSSWLSYKLWSRLYEQYRLLD